MIILSYWFQKIWELICLRAEVDLFILRMNLSRSMKRTKEQRKWLTHNNFMILWISIKWQKSGKFDLFKNHRFIHFLFYCTLFADTETKVRTSCFATSFKTKWKFTPQILELETYGHFCYLEKWRKSVMVLRHEKFLLKPST